MEAWVQALGSDFQYVAAAAVFVLGVIAGYIVGRINDRVLRTAGVPEAIESTSLERTARKFGTDTVAIIARGSSWVIYVISALYALEVANIVRTGVLLNRVAHFLPTYLVALFIAIFGLLLADKIEVLVDEYLRSVKVPEISLLSTVVRYTVVFVSLLVALAQIGIAVGALLVLLAAYLIGIVVFVTVAFHQLLIAAGTGLYLILHQPFGIGDRIEIGDREGIVQEITLFVTHIETDGREFIVPNHLVFREGAVLIRD